MTRKSHQKGIDKMIREREEGRAGGRAEILTEAHVDFKLLVKSLSRQKEMTRHLSDNLQCDVTSKNLVGFLFS